MNFKNNGPSIKLIQLLSLKNRMTPMHSKYVDIENDIGKRKAGEYGENSLNYFLSLIQEIEHEFQVVRDLRLPFKEKHFQIDTLLLFPSFFIILEVKHLTGTLEFDPDFQQLLQTKRRMIYNSTNQSDFIDELKSLQDPILQVKRQYTQFQTWLKNSGLEDYPGRCLVVLTNQNSIFKAISDNNAVQRFVVRSAGLPFKVEQMINNYTSKRFSIEELGNLSRALNKSSVQKETDILKEYGIKVSELETGVICVKCETYTMGRLRGRWKCSRCSYISKDAHINALKDFSLLVGTMITTKQCCEFLRLKSPYIARGILKSMNLKEKGNTYSKKYLLEIAQLRSKP